MGGPQQPHPCCADAVEGQYLKPLVSVEHPSVNEPSVYEPLFDDLVDLHPRQMGAEAAVMLGAALDGQRQKNQATVPVVLRQRASTLRIR